MYQYCLPGFTVGRVASVPIVVNDWTEENVWLVGPSAAAYVGGTGESRDIRINPRSLLLAPDAVLGAVICLLRELRARHGWVAQTVDHPVTSTPIWRAAPFTSESDAKAVSDLVVNARARLCGYFRERRALGTRGPLVLVDFNPGTVPRPILQTLPRLPFARVRVHLRPEVLGDMSRATGSPVAQIIGTMIDSARDKLANVLSVAS